MVVWGGVEAEPGEDAVHVRLDLIKVRPPGAFLLRAGARTGGLSLAETR